MKKLAVSLMLVVSLASCGQSSALDIPEGELEDDQIMTNEEQNILIDGPGTAEEKQQAICDDMMDAGTFAEGVTAEDVGC